MIDINPGHNYMVGIDSDGCAFDTMELKHKECFIPNTISHYGLQGVSKYAREAAEFVNLYSKTRGINRFPALIKTLELTNQRPEVRARGMSAEIPQAFRDWLQRETKLGNPTLEREVERTDDAALRHALTWSKAVNKSIAKMVSGVPPFPFVRESLEKLRGRADVLVVSATPNEALEREWAEHGLAQFTVAICGQEVGSKAETLASAAKYPVNHALMIGDAPGDHRAAVANNVLFFPINPGAEEESWQRFYEEGIDRFFADTFAGEYQESLLAEFDRRLPERPPWQIE